MAAGGGTAGVLGLGCIVQRVRGLEVLVAFCVFSVLVSVDFFLCPWRHDRALSSVPSLRGFSLGDWFWLLPRCFVRCGVGRGGLGVRRRAAARRASLSWMHRAACA